METAPPPERPMDIEIKPNIDYARHDGVALKGDLYAPKAPGKYPAMVAIHGGGWQQGSRESFRHWGQYLASRGYVLFAPSYRLSKPGEPGYPGAVHDVRAAVQFVKHSAASLNVDPARVGLMGDSAGGHLAALVALAGDHATFAGAYRDDPFASVSTKVKAVVGTYGVYDLVAQWNHDLGPRLKDSICEKFLGAAPHENRRVYFDASPVSYATSDANATAFLLSYGTEDDIVDRATQSEPFLVALKQARFYARTVVMQGAGHFWMSDPIEEPLSYSGHLAPRLMRFLAEKL
jgi:acetyl esterase/lipase